MGASRLVEHLVPVELAARMYGMNLATWRHDPAVRAICSQDSLDRLTDEGLIELDHEEIVDNRLRRYYRITREGAERLAEEADRLHANASAALLRLRPGVVTT